MNSLTHRLYSSVSEHTEAPLRVRTRHYLLAVLLLVASLPAQSALPQPSLAGPPNNASNLDPNNFTFYWSISNGYYQPYLIYRIAGESWDPHTPGYTTGSTYTTRLQPNTSYEWQVAATDPWRSNPNTNDWYTWSELRTFRTGDGGTGAQVCTPNHVESFACTTSTNCPGMQTRTCKNDGSGWLSGECHDAPGDDCPAQQGAVPIAREFSFPLECYSLDNSNGFGHFVQRPDPCTDGNYYKRHLGEDVGAIRGTPVYAAADGIVRFAGPSGDCNRGWGSLVIVESALTNGQPFCIIYGHITNSVNSSTTVSRGSLLGHVANFDCWSDHLHFSVYKGPYSEIRCTESDGCQAHGYLCSYEFPGKYGSPNDFIACQTR
jgi:hypothetical protein